MGKVLGLGGALFTLIVLAVSAAVVLGSASDGSGSAGSTTYPTYVYRVVVPEGTAEKIKLGQREISMPLSIDLRVGDSIELINHDTVVQAMGPFRARPGETVRHVFTEPLRTKGACTFEPGGMPVYINVHENAGQPVLIDGRPWQG